MRYFFAVVFAFLSAVAIGSGGCSAGGNTDSDPDCIVGSEGCPCTRGGACDPGLECLSNICVDPNGSGGNGGSAGGNGGSGNTGNDDCVPGDGCQAVDVIFALDSSQSMNEENGALAATQAFAGVVQAIAGINCGQVDYRIGITNDNGGGFYTPVGWTGSVPWFDSLEMTDDDIAAAFSGAAAQVIGGNAASTGCEHVLTSASNLIQSDSTGFVREGALLVLVLVTDVDDYSAYDHNPVQGDPVPTCQPCDEWPVIDPATHLANLVALKGGDQATVAAIVLAGDPNVTDDLNFCNAPGSCGCAGDILVDCAVYHANKLFDFTGLLGDNGVFHDICTGAASLPAAVTDAFNNQIDLACQELQPPA